MHQNILVRIDGTDESLPAIEEAVNLGSKYNAVVHVLYVVDETTRGDGLMGLGEQGLYTKLQKVGEQATEEMASIAKDAGVDATTEVRSGIPYETIVEYAEEIDVDTIIMSSHRYAGVRRFIYGSVAERVERTTDIPIIIVSRGTADSETDMDQQMEAPQ